MKIMVVGAGAMGSLFGGLLAEAGHDVTLVDVNAAHVEAIGSRGLRLHTDQGDRHVSSLRACSPSQASGAPDLLMVFTKTLHTSSALAGVAHLLGAHTHVLSLQNGLGNAEIIAQHVPAERILIGVTTWPADLVGPGHVHSHGQGLVRLMSADGRDHPAVAEVVQALNGAGLACTADAAVWSAIWEKVAFNAALNSICTATHCTVDQLGAIEDGLALAFAVVDEVLAVAQARGIAVQTQACKARVADAIARHVGHKPSMLQDVLAGRNTEIEAINGAVVTTAADLGIPVPCTRTLLQVVRLVQERQAGIHSKH
ncbi:2-dehydropantoate 2-reductase [Acidovorax sp. KKS102]|uniref:ketopantoate reductase family protein n=1 Tax=Acidovorax sp. KKS102 TaxID=358220 RepID=UPI00028B3430|nr:2-dehydropantoate 2-reductase [Acidovorax sp. KKS102]AFU48402.1 2-dehydropantoate 2-reductase [Acidovorax sp. KKS102]